MVNITLSNVKANSFVDINTLSLSPTQILTGGNFINVGNSYEILLGTLLSPLQGSQISDLSIYDNQVNVILSTINAKSLLNANNPSEITANQISPNITYGNVGNTYGILLGNIGAQSINFFIQPVTNSPI